MENGAVKFFIASLNWNSEVIDCTLNTTGNMAKIFKICRTIGQHERDVIAYID